jgi:hypothetical protein
MCFTNLAEWSYLEKPELTSSWKHLSCREYSFQTLTQFWPGINALDASGPETNGFLLRDTCFCSTQLNRPIWKKRRLFTPWILWFAGSTILKIIRILNGNPFDGRSSYYTDGFLSKSIMYFQMNLQRSRVGQDRNKMSTYPPWKMWFAASIPFKNDVSSQGKQCARCSCS